jgi:hypothetical protein
MGERRNAFRLLVGKLERKKPLGRPRRRCVWVCNSKMDVRDDGMVWTGLVWLRIETTGEVLWMR